jgi:hypothetical protein
MECPEAISASGRRRGAVAAGSPHCARRQRRAASLRHGKHAGRVRSRSLLSWCTVRCAHGAAGWEAPGLRFTREGRSFHAKADSHHSRNSLPPGQPGGRRKVCIPSRNPVRQARDPRLDRLGILGSPLTLRYSETDSHNSRNALGRLLPKSRILSRNPTLLCSIHSESDSHNSRNAPERLARETANSFPKPDSALLIHSEAIPIIPEYRRQRSCDARRRTLVTKLHLVTHCSGKLHFPWRGCLRAASGTSSATGSAEVAKSNFAGKVRDQVQLGHEVSRAPRKRAARSRNRAFLPESVAN